MKAVIYARVSSREQEEQGYSLPAQEKFLQDYAGHEGLSVTKVFAIAESASGKKQREIFNGMLDYLNRKNIKIILCEKVDRLTRTHKVAVQVNDWIHTDEERQVHFAKENFILHKEAKSNEKFIWNIKVSVAQYYIENMSEEVKKGQKEKLAQGWLPKKPPMGYITVGDERKKIHVIDEKVGPLVKEAFELYATGQYSLKKLLALMTENGLRSESGRELHLSMLHRILSNPFYCGKMVWKGDVMLGAHDPLISQDVFNQVRSLLTSKGTPKYRKHFYLFKGLLKCSACQGKITWEQHKGHVYGHCNYQYTSCPLKRWYKQEDVEGKVLKKMNEFKVKSPEMAEWIKKALKESHKDEMTYYTSSVSELNKHLERITQRLDRLYDDKLDGTITAAIYQRKTQQFAGEQENIQNQLKRHANAKLKYFEMGVNIYELALGGSQLYLTATDEEKRVLLSLMFEELWLADGVLNVTYTSPFRSLHEAVTETNRSIVVQKAAADFSKLEPATFATRAPESFVKKDFAKTHTILQGWRESNPH
jgi:site-specific DNA recombinase